MRALITGGAGQDGTILARMLEREGASVTGLVKPGTDANALLRYAPNTRIVECDLADAEALRAIVLDEAPNEIYNFGGISSIMESVNNPELTRQVNIEGPMAILDAMRELRRGGHELVRMVQAASGTIFENVDRSPQTEATAPAPRTPYAQSKAEIMSVLRTARTDEGIFAVSAVLYNHESPLRGAGFVTRKITMAVARIAAGLQDQLELGDIEVARDWGWAPDYVQGMRLMIRAEQPNDYLLATGISHRLSFFIDRAFKAAGITDWAPYVVSTEANTRAADTNLLTGESRAAREQLGWRHTVDFDSMAARMVAYDMALLKDPDLLWLDF